VIFRCACGREVKTQADLIELRLEARRKVQGSYDRWRTVSLGFKCRECAEEEIEKRRPDPYGMNRAGRNYPPPQEIRYRQASLEEL
jgi:hypothetical protein